MLDAVLNRPSRQLVLALGLAATGLAATHRSVAVAIAIWGLSRWSCECRSCDVPVLRDRWDRVRRPCSPHCFWPRSLPLCARTRWLPAALTNAPFESPGAAVGRLVVFNTNRAQPHWTLALRLVVGVALAIRMRSTVSVLATLGLTAAVDLLARAAPRLRPQSLPAQAARLRALALAVTVLLFSLATSFAYSGTHVQIIR
ncbi:MAG: hypothetical protein ACXVGA_09695, partial [Mycobacteriaceae bacterium]